MAQQAVRSETGPGIVRDKVHVKWRVNVACRQTRFDRVPGYIQKYRSGHQGGHRLGRAEDKEYFNRSLMFAA